MERGDRVVAYMPNLPETVAAFLAVASLGAVWSSCSPDFGAVSVVDRFAQVEPKVLLAVDGYRYNGNDFDRADVIARLQKEMPSLQRTVILPYLGSDGDWDEVFGPTDEPLEPVRVPFDHPLWILYSSGTTGLPKAIVHSQGGILIEHLKLLGLHTDAQEGDRLFWFTTTGWMMWNFLVAGLLTDAAIVLYDGSPAHPEPDVLWDLAERAGITCFGTSASYIASCMKAGVEPAQGRDLSALRSIGSTGSPLAPEGFEWIYEHVGDDTWLFSTSGGTDVCTAFVGGVPLLPVYRGELQGRALGARVEAYDEDGNPVIDEVGELVITAPMPSMPIYFWNDPDGERYRESYFDMFPGVWRHGDWIRITERGTAVISGRSDSTINRGGIRMGTAEIYRAVLALDEITDALVVDVPRGDEAWMPLFVVLREGAQSSTTTSSRRSGRGSARTARRATSPTRSSRSPRCRARCRASCSRCRSRRSSPAPPPSRRRRATRWPIRRRSTTSSSSPRKRKPDLPTRRAALPRARPPALRARAVRPARLGLSRSAPPRGPARRRPRARTAAPLRVPPDRPVRGCHRPGGRAGRCPHRPGSRRRPRAGGSPAAGGGRAAAVDGGACRRRRR